MKDRAIAFLFSGQGSQYYQMGQSLYENNSVFKRWMDAGAEIAAPQLGLSLTELLYRQRTSKFDPPFDRTLYTHPTLFIIEYAVTQVLLSYNIRPDLLLGYSMGECVALAVAESLTFEDSIKLLIRQAELIEQSTEPASMLAVLETPEIRRKHPDIFEDTELAGINYDKHFVITGRPPAIERANKFLNDREILAQILPVRHGFHSPLIDPVADEYQEYCKTIPLRPPNIEIVSSCYGRKLEAADLSSDFVWRVVRSPIQFKLAIDDLEQRRQCLYIDAGPAGTLAAFLRQITGDPTRAKMTLNQFGHDQKNIETLRNICGAANDGSMRGDTL